MLSAFDNGGPDESGCDDVTHGCPASKAARTLRYSTCTI